jgi:hypothetical protein
MQTITDAPVVTAKKESLVRRTRNTVAAVLAFLTCLIAPGIASAQTPTDATDGAGASFIADLQEQFLNYVVPAALGLMVAVLGISVLVAWGRKAVKSR